MKNETFKGTIENAYGLTLPTAVKFEGSYESVENFAEIPEKEKPSQDDIVDYVNAKRKANARQKSMNEALTAAGIVKPTLENNTDLQVKTMVKALTASGKYNEEQATAIAKQTLGL